LRLVAEGLSVGLAVSNDVDLGKALDRLTDQIAEADTEGSRLEAKLANPEFSSKAPPEVITEHRERLRTLTRDRALLVSSREQLQAMLGG
jgi:valyl-tRNA synthetase